ncbi:NAD-dependent epimerase/dehydratase family protein [Paenibacillus sp.]|uniref:NAD-dependent epimerase/dehydratase family protein n=1 Tax=Paenibacillus sp. TaxID=58172 RepID=UPI002D458D0E|nr:NAD-dependent epimerase/dehydratase family protein [Paenibacillus sp.]HZG86174.1 NAD-dependent epimerase/dehydratase family protein [Paenibacillus sp.]
MFNNVVVTGGTGFVGSHLVKRLVDLDCQVHVIVRPSSELHLLKSVENKVNFHVFSGETNHLSEMFKQFQPELVFHLASLFISEHTSEQVLPLIGSNVAFSAQILEAMAVSGTNYIVNTGTAWQHFKGEDYNPVNLYAATKQAFESILTYYVEARGVRATTLKLFDTYGPDDPRKKLFHLLHHVSMSGQRLDMSPGEQLINVVYIDDVVDAFILAGRLLIEQAIGNNSHFAVASNEVVSLRKLVSIYSELTGRDLNINWGGRQYRSREVMFPWSNGPTLPGWTPKVSLEKGIRLLEQAVRSNSKI